MHVYNVNNKQYIVKCIHTTGNKIIDLKWVNNFTVSKLYSSDELKEVEMSRWSKKDKLCVVMDDQL